MARFTLPRDLYHGKGALEALKSFTGKKAMICVGGGSMSFSGGGNWLIALSPYCFPLLAVGIGNIVNIRPLINHIFDGVAEDVRFIERHLRNAFNGLLQRRRINRRVSMC